MSKTPNPSPYTVTESTVRNPLAEKQWAYLTKGENAPLNIMLRDASWKGQVLAGMAKNDPEAQKAFFGRTPTAEDWARLKGGTGKVIPKITPTQTAAQGGLMSVRRFSDGGGTEGITPLGASQTSDTGITPVGQEAPKEASKALTDEQIAFVQQAAKKMQSGKELTQAEKDRLDKIELNTGRDVSPYSATGTKAPGDPAVAKAAESIRGSYAKANPAGDSTTTPTPDNAGLSLADAYSQTPIGFDPGLLDIDPATGAPKYMADPYGGVTNPFYREAIDQMNSMQRPEEYGQASDMYRTAGAGLESLAGYTPQQVAAERASAERASAAQMAAIADVQASQMAKPEDVAAQKLERYQMGETGPISTDQSLTAYQMEGPGSWTDENVSNKYMSPYMQGVIDISKREAERDYLKQVNALNAKAMSAGAFGGSRQALERSEMQRNYNEQLQDLQVRGLQQAYESGRSQYGQELGLSQQAALQNLQSKLSTQSQASQQNLQAMLSNQNIDYQTKLQNLQAMLGVQGQEAQMMLNAALANQQTAFGTNQTNAQLAQQAALANQQTQFGVGSLNANLLNQTNLQNASLGTQANLANQAAALQASLANQQAGLQGNQQNIAAYGAMGNMASGLGSIGNYNAAYDQQQFTNYGAMGNTWQQTAQEAERQRMINAYNAQNPGAPLMPVINAVSGVPTGGAQDTQGVTRTA